MGSIIHVAVGLIVDDEHLRVLIAQRPQGTHLGGLWEFPGGKVEAGETVIEALARELQEELAITVTDCTPLFKAQHDYPEQSVLLDIWQVSRFSGIPQGGEGQAVRWVSLHEINDYPFPAADHPILEYLAVHLGSKQTGLCR